MNQESYTQESCISGINATALCSEIWNKLGNGVLGNLDEKNLLFQGWADQKMSGRQWWEHLCSLQCPKTKGWYIKSRERNMTPIRAGAELNFPQV